MKVKVLKKSSPEIGQICFWNVNPIFTALAQWAIFGKQNWHCGMNQQDEVHVSQNLLTDNWTSSQVARAAWKALVVILGEAARHKLVDP